MVWPARRKMFVAFPPSMNHHHDTPHTRRLTEALLRRARATAKNVLILGMYRDHDITKEFYSRSWAAGAGPLFFGRQSHR